MKHLRFLFLHFLILLALAFLLSPSTFAIDDPKNLSDSLEGKWILYKMTGGTNDIDSTFENDLNFLILTPITETTFSFQWWENGLIFYNGIATLVEDWPSIFGEEYFVISVDLGWFTTDFSFRLYENENNKLCLDLVQNDFGSLHYHFVKDVGEDGSNTDDWEQNIIYNIVLFPNPTTNECILTLDLEDSGILFISLKNILGEELLEINNSFIDVGTFKTSFSLKDFTQGIYFLNIQHQENLIIKKIIINK